MRVNEKAENGTVLVGRMLQRWMEIDTGMKHTSGAIGIIMKVDGRKINHSDAAIT